QPLPFSRQGGLLGAHAPPYGRASLHYVISVLRPPWGHHRLAVGHLSVQSRHDLSAPCRVAAMSAPPVRHLGRRLAAGALAAAALLAAAPASAPAALRWRSCSNVDGFECATLRVPLDRGGAVPGTIPLRVAREKRTVKGGGIFISLSGGPGQGAVAVAPFVADAMAPALLHRRLVVLDQ